MCHQGTRAAHPAEHHAEGTCRAGRRGGGHDQTIRKDRRGTIPHRPHHRPGFEAAGGLHRALQNPGRPDLALPSRTEEAPAAREEEMRLNVFLNSYGTSREVGLKGTHNNGNDCDIADVALIVTASCSVIRTQSCNAKC